MLGSRRWAHTARDDCGRTRGPQAENGLRCQWHGGRAVAGARGTRTRAHERRGAKVDAAHVVLRARVVHRCVLGFEQKILRLQVAVHHAPAPPPGRLAPDQGVAASGWGVVVRIGLAPVARQPGALHKQTPAPQGADTSAVRRAGRLSWPGSRRSGCELRRRCACGGATRAACVHARARVPCRPGPPRVAVCAHEVRTCSPGTPQVPSARRARQARARARGAPRVAVLDDLQQRARLHGRVALRQVPALHDQVEQLAACAPAPEAGLRAPCPAVQRRSAHYGRPASPGVRPSGGDPPCWTLCFRNSKIEKQMGEKSLLPRASVLESRAARDCLGRAQRQAASGCQSKPSSWPRRRRARAHPGRAP